MRAILRRIFAVLARPTRRREMRQAVLEWERRQTELRARFFELAKASGKPHGLAWRGCEWNGSVRFAREKTTRLLTALTGLVVRFEAIEGGGMEEVEAVSLPRDATAVFHYRDGWGTGGRALFNMGPDEAIARLGDQFEAIEVATGEAEKT